MPRGLKTALTLMALLALIAFGGMWAWGAFTEPFPERSRPQACTDTTLKAGESLTPEKVLVSVYNASKRVGLAGLTSDGLKGRGFVIDRTGDAPDDTKVAIAQVWTTNPKSPDAVLVRTYLGKGARIVKAEPLRPGITVVVGRKFKEVTKGRKSLELTEDTVVCVPPAPE
jgi:LytR cell envelope-related transcriptional attenuator